jgi:hypothetical protein
MEAWHEQEHLGRYPLTARRPQFGEADVESGGFRLVARERYELEVTLDRERLAAYFLSQSNALAALEEGRETLEEARGWFLQVLEPFLPGRLSRPFSFGGTLWVVTPVMSHYG